MKTLEEILELNFGSEDAHICSLSWKCLKKKAKSEILELVKAKMPEKKEAVSENFMSRRNCEIKWYNQAIDEMFKKLEEL